MTLVWRVGVMKRLVGLLVVLVVLEMRWVNTTKNLRTRHNLSDKEQDLELYQHAQLLEPAPMLANPLELERHPGVAA